MVSKTEIERTAYERGHAAAVAELADRDKHNGFTNYETWAVSLWLSNEEGSQRYWSEKAREAREYAEENPEKHREQKEVAINWLADSLKDELEYAAPDLGATMWADLLNAAIGGVDWYEIAEHLLEE